MERSKLGEIYHIACDRIASAVSELYESLFDEQGQPSEDLESVNSDIKYLQRQVSAEADLIRQAIIEHKEDGEG